MEGNWTDQAGLDQETGGGGLSAGLSGFDNGVIQHTGYPDGMEVDPNGFGIDPVSAGGKMQQFPGSDLGGGGIQDHTQDLNLSIDYSFMCQSLSSMGFNLSGFEFPPTMFNMSLCNDMTPMDTNPGDFDALKEIHFAVLVVVLYIIVILVGAIGNIMVVITVIKTKQMWNATNIFIANLAISDVFVCVFDLPLSVYYQITDKWIFGEALCHVILPAFAVVVYDSTLTLTLISIDRYLLIVFPLKKKLTVKIALIFVGIIAMVSMAVASPIALYSKYVIWDDSLLNIYRQYCTEKWPSSHFRLIYTIVTLLCQYFLPLLVIGILYYLIFRRVKQRMQSAFKKKSRKTRTTKMLVAVVAVFAITWTPFHLYGLIAEVNYDLVKGRWYKLTDALLRVLAMSSSCINPILYAWLNDNYRNAFLSLVKVIYMGLFCSWNKRDPRFITVDLSDIPFAILS